MESPDFSDQERLQFDSDQRETIDWLGVTESDVREAMPDRPQNRFTGQTRRVTADNIESASFLSGHAD